MNNINNICVCLLNIRGCPFDKVPCITLESTSNGVDPLFFPSDLVLILILPEQIM